MTSNTDSNQPEPERTDDRTAGPDDDNVLGATSEAEQGSGTTEKDPEQWVTGDEAMTGAQRSYLDTLARDAGETLRGDLTKAQASEEIDRLQNRTGRGDG